MNKKVSKELANHRLEQAKEEQLQTAEELIKLVEKYLSEK